MQPDVRIIMEVSIIVIPAILTMRKSGPPTTILDTAPTTIMTTHLTIIRCAIKNMASALLTTAIIIALIVHPGQAVLELIHTLDRLMILVTGPHIITRDIHLIDPLTVPGMMTAITLVTARGMPAVHKTHQGTAVKLFALATIMLNMKVKIVLTGNHIMQK